MTDLAKVEANLPAHLQNYVGKNADDGITKDDITLPYLKVVQKTSGEIDSKEAEFGDIINSITKEKFKIPVTFIPVKYFKAYRKFENNSLVDSSDDCVHWLKSGAAIGPDDWKYKYHNFYVLIPGKEFPFVLSFAKTSARAGQLLINMIQQLSKAKGLPIFSKQYGLSAHSEDGEQGKYMVLDVKAMEGFTSETDCKRAAELLAFINEGNFKRDDQAATDVPVKG